MGARGPAPKPTVIRILEGNPGKRAINRDEPKPRPVAPDLPVWMDRGAKSEWRRIAPELERLGLLTIVDAPALASYCQSYSRLVTCERLIRKHGLTQETENGFAVPRPEVAMSRQAMQTIKAFCSEFGLTPSSRGRMTLPKVTDDDEDSPFDV